MKKLTFAALAFALAAPTAAMAQSSMTGPESHWYVGGSVGQSKLDLTCPAGFSCDDSDTAYRIFGGYNINKHFGAEFGYAALGKATFSTPGASGDAKATAWDIVAVGTLPLNEKFELYGKLGWYFADTKTSGAATGGDSNNDLTYTLGGAFNFNKNLALRVEWQQYKSVGGDNNNGDIDVMAVGVVYKFK